MPTPECRSPPLRTVLFLAALVVRSRGMVDLQVHSVLVAFGDRFVDHLPPPFPTA